MSRASAAPCSTRAGNASAGASAGPAPRPAAVRARRPAPRCRTGGPAAPRARRSARAPRRPLRNWRVGSAGRRTARRRRGSPRSSPSGRSTRAAARAYSTEVRCAGTREPPKTSATMTSAQSVRRRLQPGAGVRGVHRDARVRRAAAGARRPGRAARGRPRRPSCRESGPGRRRDSAAGSAPRRPGAAASSGRPGPRRASRTWASRRTYSNSRCVGSSRSTYDCGAPSTVSSQARCRSTSGISLAVPLVHGPDDGYRLGCVVHRPIVPVRSPGPARPARPAARSDQTCRSAPHGPLPAGAPRGPRRRAWRGPGRCARTPCGPPVDGVISSTRAPRRAQPLGLRPRSRRSARHRRPSARRSPPGRSRRPDRRWRWSAPRRR